MRPGDLARAHTSLGRAGSHAGRVYGGGAIGQAAREMSAREDRESIVTEFVTMIEEGKALCGNAFSGAPTWLDFTEWRNGIADFIGAVLGVDGKQALLEVEGATSEPRDHIAAVMDWLRERRDHPDRWTPQLWGDDLAAALRKRREGAPSDTLDHQLDSLIREGIDLVAELNVPAEPEKTKGGWKLEGGDAPEEWWEKADDFTTRIRELLIERHPALLTDYRDGYNAHVRKEREEDQTKGDPAKDKRSDGEKMLALATFERSGPRRIVEASLEGLAAARHRLGAQVSSAI